jgi:hypothetical protein
LTPIVAVETRLHSARFPQLVGAPGDLMVRGERRGRSLAAPHGSTTGGLPRHGY